MVRTETETGNSLVVSRIAYHPRVIYDIVDHNNPLLRPSPTTTSLPSVAGGTSVSRGSQGRRSARRLRGERGSAILTGLRGFGSGAGRPILMSGVFRRSPPRWSRAGRARAVRRVVVPSTSSPGQGARRRPRLQAPRRAAGAPSAPGSWGGDPLEVGGVRKT